MHKWNKTMMPSERWIKKSKKYKATYIKIYNKHLNNRIMNRPHNGYGMAAFLINFAMKLLQSYKVHMLLHLPKFYYGK